MLGKMLIYNLISYNIVCNTNTTTNANEIKALTRVESEFCVLLLQSAIVCCTLEHAHFLCCDCSPHQNTVWTECCQKQLIHVITSVDCSNSSMQNMIFISGFWTEPLKLLQSAHKTASTHSLQYTRQLTATTAVFGKSETEQLIRKM